MSEADDLTIPPFLQRAPTAGQGDVPTTHNEGGLPLQQPEGSKPNPAKGNVGRLPEFVKRVEKLEEERTAISTDIRDVYSEAKGVGYDTKTIRALVRLRKLDAADRAEQETLLDTYKHALGMV